MVPLPHLCVLTPVDPEGLATFDRWRRRLASGVLVGNIWTIEEVPCIEAVTVAEHDALAFLQDDPADRCPQLGALAQTFLDHGKPVVELARQGLAVRLHNVWPPTP